MAFDFELFPGRVITMGNKVSIEKNKRQEGQDPGGEYPVTNRPDEQQLIPPKGEEYLRESGSIEDLPDPSEEEEINREK
jgi:hypothetical protein